MLIIHSSPTEFTHNRTKIDKNFQCGSLAVLGGCRYGKKPLQVRLDLIFLFCHGKPSSNRFSCLRRFRFLSLLAILVTCLKCLHDNLPACNKFQPCGVSSYVFSFLTLQGVFFCLLLTLLGTSLIYDAIKLGRRSRKCHDLVSWKHY